MFRTRVTPLVNVKNVKIKKRKRERENERSPTSMTTLFFCQEIFEKIFESTVVSTNVVISAPKMMWSIMCPSG